MVVHENNAPLAHAFDSLTGKLTSACAELTTVIEADAKPRQLLGRLAWERRYTNNLRLTDTLVVCGAVLLAQYLRFGSTPVADNVMGRYHTAYSAVLAIIWLSALAGLRARSPKYIGTGIEEY